MRATFELSHSQGGGGREVTPFWLGFLGTLLKGSAQ